MRPYYESKGITIYHGDCREILPAIKCEAGSSLVSDPPYGIGYSSSSSRSVKAMARDHEVMIGDDKPFDPSWLLGMPWARKILFGANHYAHLLPPSPCWIVWDKICGLKSNRPLGFNNSADCELIWTDLDSPARIIRHTWIGMLKGSEREETRDHPTQKPVYLMGKLIECLTPGGSPIVDPYAGSGTTLKAAKDLGRRAIGIEIEEKYCEIAVKRLAQEVLFTK